MKNILFGLLICFASVGTNAMTFKIEGKIKGLMPGDTLSFERITLPNYTRVFAFNVIVEKQDEFTYKGSHKDIGYYMMTYKPASKKAMSGDKLSLAMLIKNGTTRLVGTADQIYYSQIQGGLYENELLQ